MQSHDLPDTRLPTVGDRIREVMAAKRLSQSRIAVMSGLDRADVNRIVNNHRPPRLTELPLLSAALGITVEDLLRDVEIPPDYRRKLEELHQSALRLIEAEAARDEAMKQAEGLRTAVSAAGLALHQEQERSAQERQKLQAQFAQERQKFAAECAERLSRAEREKADLATELGGARWAIVQKDGRIAELEGTLAALRDEVATLRKSLADENSAKVLTGVLSGIAGMVGGAAFAKINTASDDGDDENE